MLSTSSCGVAPAATHWFDEGRYFSAAGAFTPSTERMLPSGRSDHPSSDTLLILLAAAAHVEATGS
jgi:hypothetical protein